MPHRSPLPRPDLLAAALPALLLCASAPAAAESAEAPPGEITFVASNIISTANGTFHRWRVTRADVDPSDLSRGEVEVEVDIASVDTGIEDRDEHLRTADFFEVERWPTATVRVYDARPNGSDADGNARYAARFDVRIRDVSKTLDGEFTLVPGAAGEALRAEGALELDRMDFGIGDPESRWNPFSITQKVPIAFRVTLPK